MPDTYLKLNDSLPEHRKIVDAGGDAAWLHVCALAYASRNLTDGSVPAGVVPRLSDRRQPTKLAARLVEVGLWHASGHGCPRCPQPGPSEYVIHDYLVHQRSAAKVEEIKAKRAVAGQRGGSKKAANARASAKPTGKQTPSNLLGTQERLVEANQVTERTTPAGNKSKRRGPEAATGQQANADKNENNAGPGAEGPSNLLEGWKPLVVAKATPEAEVVLRTTRTEKDLPPTAGADAPRHADVVPIGDLTITQRSKRLTDAYYAAEPMSNWNGVNQIVIKAIRSGKWADQEIGDALLRLASDNRGVSVETLRRELAPPTNHASTQAVRSTTDDRVAQAQRLKATFAAKQEQHPPTIQGELSR